MPNDTSIKIDLIPDDPESLSINCCHIDNETLTIQWASDNITTDHDLRTLRACAYDASSRIKRKQSRYLWDSRNTSAIRVFNYRDLNESETILEICFALRDCGLVRLRNVPPEPGAVGTIAEKFGPIHAGEAYNNRFPVRRFEFSPEMPEPFFPRPIACRTSVLTERPHSFF